MNTVIQLSLENILKHYGVHEKLIGDMINDIRGCTWMTKPRFVYFEYPSVEEAAEKLSQNFPDYHIVPGSIEIRRAAMISFSCLLERDQPVETSV
jgi:hypothetical protein